MPEFYVIFARKLTKLWNFSCCLPEKMSEFYMIIARKLFFPIFEGRGTCPPTFPISYAYGRSAGLKIFQYGGFDLEL